MRRKVARTPVYVSYPTNLGMMFTEKPPRHRAAFVSLLPTASIDVGPFPVYTMGTAFQ